MEMTNLKSIFPEIGIKPNGSVVLETDALLSDDLNSDAVKRLTRAFSRSTAEGLSFSVSQKFELEPSASLFFLQDFTRRYFRALCRLGQPRGDEWISPEPPDDETLDGLLSTAPPMKGLEYLTCEGLISLWRQLDEFTKRKALSRKTGLAGYLKSLHPDWNPVGRVTFHLAENKRDPDHPFAFMATFTPTSGATRYGNSPVRHVPLSQAFKESLESEDRRQLDVLLEPVSRAARTVPLIAEQLESRALFSPQAWGISLAHRFLQSVPTLEESGVTVRVPDWWNAARPPRPRVDVRVGTKARVALSLENLDLQVGVSIDGDPLTQDELKQLTEARQGLTFLRGKWVQVDGDRLQSALSHWESLRKEHRQGIDFLTGMRLLSGAAIGSNELSDELQQWTRIQPGSWLQGTLDSLRDPGGKISLPETDQLQATLRPYQSAGVRWLWLASQLGLGVCLADDMGLGKTIQVVSLLLHLKAQRATGSQSKSQLARNKKNGSRRDRNTPALLILPTSLLGNWKREIEKFAPSLTLTILHRSMTDAETLREIAEDPKGRLKGVDVVATTYGLARREKWLGDVNWQAIVLDEAQAIKNAGAAQTKAIKSIPGTIRIALTGTPVENHPGDLWSLFDFCQPGLLGTATEFKKFVKAKDANELSQRLGALRKLVRPYVLRRMKTDPRIISDLPQKTEMRIDCGLTRTQATLYRTITKELDEALDSAEGIQRRGMVLAALMQLKQVCNHPSLYLKQSDFPAKDSAKFSELETICRTLIEKQEKMLVFTQFQSMCRPLSEFLSEVFGQPGLELTGKTATRKRQQLVKQFQDEDGPPFFVISLKAGGTGLNLTAASHVVHFDRWWNPAVEDQATDRAFRIGQKRNVIVHKFVCRGTLEERIDDLIHSKRKISRELFDDDSGEFNLTELSNEELIDFVSLDLSKATTT